MQLPANYFASQKSLNQASIIQPFILQMQASERSVLNFHISFNFPASLVYQKAEATKIRHALGAATPCSVRERILDQSKIIMKAFMISSFSGTAEKVFHH